MKIAHSINELTTIISKENEKGKRVGFVPTMGNLHAGHISLIEKVKSFSDFSVASVFVNPMQFGENEDLDNYPRTLKEDSEKLSHAGCDLLFAPTPSEIYPNGMDKHLKMNMPHMSGVLCGNSRPTHFEGVCTVVTKLFNIVRPDVAVFGKKDLQQLLIIKQMVKDLCLSIEVVGSDTARESNGLAMSSRNGFLSPDEKEAASIIYKTLQQLRDEIVADNLKYKELMGKARLAVENKGFKVDYLEIRTIEALNLAKDGEQYDNLAIFAAAYAEKTRLIDNITLNPLD